MRYLPKGWLLIVLMVVVVAGVFYLTYLGLSQEPGPVFSDDCNFNYLGNAIGETPPPC